MALFSDGMAGLIGHGEELRRERVANESSGLSRNGRSHRPLRKDLAHHEAGAVYGCL